MCARPRKSPDAISAGCFFCYFSLRQRKVDLINKKFLQSWNLPTLPSSQVLCRDFSGLFY